MLILKRRYEYWFCLLALHKIGAIAIPATHLLTRKDLVYRNSAASVTAIVCVDEPTVLDNVDASAPESPTLVHRISLSGARPGWRSLREGMSTAGASLERLPTDNGDTSLLYFTSGTTGMPKMVQHDFAYPLGHILTAKYWQHVEDGGLHLTVADTGWAKAAWGKIYGQWICGSAVFVYDYDRFVPANLLGVIATAPGHLVLRPAHHVPLLHQGGPDAVRLQRPAHLRRWPASRSTRRSITASRS